MCQGSRFAACFLGLLLFRRAGLNFRSLGSCHSLVKGDPFNSSFWLQMVSIYCFGGKKLGFCACAEASEGSAHSDIYQQDFFEFWRTPAYDSSHEELVVVCQRTPIDGSIQKNAKNHCLFVEAGRTSNILRENIRHLPIPSEGGYKPVEVVHRELLPSQLPLL